MSQLMNQIIDDIHTLSSTEKSLLAQCIISSLDNEHNDEAVSKWADVAKKRYEELVSGQVTSVSWESIKSKVIGA